MVDDPITVTPTGCRLQILAAPRARKTRLVGVHDQRLKLQVAAPPVDGQANAAIVKFFARALGVRQADVALTHGVSSKRKTLEVVGVTPDEAAHRLGVL